MERIKAVAAALMRSLGKPNIPEKNFRIVSWAVSGLGFALGPVQGVRQIQRSGARR